MSRRVSMRGGVLEQLYRAIRFSYRTSSESKKRNEAGGGSLMINKTTIEIAEYSACKVTMHGSDGTKINKSITYDKLLSMLNSATSDAYDEECECGEVILSDILPGDELISTIQVKEILASNSKWYILLRESSPVDIKYYNKTYKKVAMPRTLYALKISNNKCVSMRICCIKDRFISPTSTIYMYPYSNVFDTRSVCLGGNRINDFDIETLSNIVMIPEMFLSMANNNDGYTGSNNSGFNYKDLLELMSNSKFDNSILVRSNHTPTYKSFIDSLK